MTPDQKPDLVLEWSNLSPPMGYKEWLESQLVATRAALFRAVQVKLDYQYDRAGSIQTATDEEVEREMAAMLRHE